MNVSEEIKRLENGIVLLEVIRNFKRRLNSIDESLKGIPGMIPEQRRCLLNEQETIESNIEILESDYKNLMLN